MKITRKISKMPHALSAKSRRRNASAKREAALRYLLAYQTTRRMDKEPVKMANEIEELEALLEKITPGPLRLRALETARAMTERDHPSLSKAAERYHKHRREQAAEEQAFIAAARNLLPTLLQALKDKDAEIERLTQLLLAEKVMRDDHDVLERLAKGTNDE